MLTYNGMQEGFSEWIATMRKTVKASLYIEVSTYVSKFGEVVILLGLNDTDILAVCVVFSGLLFFLLWFSLGGALVFAPPPPPPPPPLPLGAENWRINPVTLFLIDGMLNFQTCSNMFTIYIWCQTLDKVSYYPESLLQRNKAV